MGGCLDELRQNLEDNASFLERMVEEFFTNSLYERLTQLLRENSETIKLNCLRIFRLSIHGRDSMDIIMVRKLATYS